MRGIRFVVAAAAAFAGFARADVVTLTPSKDNTLYNNVGGILSSGLGDGMFVGDNANGELRRGVIAFDLSGIPAGSTINSASFTLNMTRTRAGSTPISLHRLNASWGEGTSAGGGNGGSGYPSTIGDATWIHRFYDTILWASAGGDFAATASATTSVGGVGTYTWSSAGLTSDIQNWVNLPSTNFGWIIRGVETGTVTTKRFATKEATTVSTRPKLTINFTPPANVGACCFSLGGCSLVPPELCTAQGGVFSGVGTSCTPNNCPQPTGACCLPGLVCQILTADQCTAASGTYQGNFSTCFVGLCAQPTGACCATNGVCQVLRQDQCTAQNGIYRGDNTVCSVGLCPIQLTPFVDALPIPALAIPTLGFPGGAASYTIAAREFPKILHRDLPPTRVWGYNGMYPGPTIEAFRNQQVNVTWVNDLRDEQNNLRQHHYLPVDMCLHGPMQEGDAPRIVTHLHGGHTEAASDGFPETTILPGESSYQYHYPNSQTPATLWYHDHALGITRLNVYMGLAGAYILRDQFENGLSLPTGTYEVPLIIQDRSFNPDGSLRYMPMWDEHFIGDFILVNGKVWPFMNVDRGKYRFRVVNGSGTRVYTLKLSNNASFQQIGSDGGLLPAPVTMTELTLLPAERADLIMDFAPYAAGTEIILTNSAPAPFPGDPGVGVIPNVMKFVVQATQGFTSPVPAALRPVTRLQETAAAEHREFQLQRLTGTCPTVRWMINGLGWDTLTEVPRLETTEVWSFINRSGESHPMHVHLVDFQILDRQNFDIVGGQVVPTGPVIQPAPNEMGWKDTVHCPPLQITRIITRFSDYTGRYTYHCHILEHEDNEMMRQFQSTCYVNCDGSTVPPILNALDFQCFLNRFAAGKPDANCDNSTIEPVLNALDFLCFINKFAQGCP